HSDADQNDLAHCTNERRQAEFRSSSSRHSRNLTGQDARHSIQTNRNSPYRSGTGTMGRPRWPASSTACTAKMTLSLEKGSVTFRPLLTDCACSQSGAEVARHRISYATARPSVPASQESVESFVSFFVSRHTFCGAAGADARLASVAAFIRATLATYSKLANFGKSPYSIPFSARTF